VLGQRWDPERLLTAARLDAPNVGADPTPGEGNVEVVSERLRTAALVRRQQMKHVDRHAATVTHTVVSHDDHRWPVG
jgi:hypothetical protein